MIDEDVLEKMISYIRNKDISSLNRQIDGLSYEHTNIVSLFSEAIKISSSYEILEVFLDKFFHFKLYSEINKIYIKLLKNRDYDDVMSLIYHLNGISVKNIEKLKDSEEYNIVIINLIDFSDYLYSMEWMYECSMVLNITSLFITASNIFPSNIVKYFEILSYFFLDNNLFYSFLNTINNLIYLDSKLINKYGTLEEFRKIVEYCKYKNERSKYNGLLCKLTMVDENEIYNKIEKLCENDNDGILIRNNVDFKMWDFYIQNVNKEIDLESNINLISFFKLNDIEYSLVKNKIYVGSYKYKSIALKIHDIVNAYESDEKKVIKKIENLRIEQNVIKEKLPATDDKSMTKTKKVGIKFEDNYKIKKAKFRIYCLIARKILKNLDTQYEKRDNDRNLRYRMLDEKNRKLKEEMLDLKDIIDELKTELEQRIYDSFEKREVSRNIDVSVKKSGNWRDEDSGESTNPKIYISRSTRNNYRKEDVLSDRNIYIYNYNSSIHSDNQFVKQYESIASTQHSSKNTFNSEVHPTSRSFRDTNNSANSKIYNPPDPNQVLKNTYDMSSNSSSKGIYVPPKPSDVLKNINTTLKGTNSNISSKSTRKSDWYDSQSDE